MSFFSGIKSALSGNDEADKQPVATPKKKQPTPTTMNNGKWSGSLRVLKARNPAYTFYEDNSYGPNRTDRIIPKRLPSLGRVPEVQKPNTSLLNRTVSGLDFWDKEENAAQRQQFDGAVRLRNSSNGRG